MKSKAPLALMEQLVMVLVFALAAALCLQVFVLADRTSRRSENRDRAVPAVQNAAETLKGVGQTGGDMGYTLEEAAHLLGGTVSQGLLCVCYDVDWNQVEDGDGCVYRLHAQGQPAPVEGLRQAAVWVDAMEDIRVGGTYSGPLFELTVAWQEVRAHG